jgi:cobyric acid synthase CobQ/L-threonine-O-3-phosphate decarboxylase
MQQSFLSGLSERLQEERRYAHGGDLRRLAEKAGCAPSELLDFSVCLNPLGPPSWLAREVGRALAEVAAYPDPEAADVTLAACELYKVWPTQVLAGNGASELIQAATRLGSWRQAVIPAPTYVDYGRVCRQAGLPIRTLALSPGSGFALDFAALERELTAPSLVFLCRPNNPTGRGFEAETLRQLALRQPQSLFVVDESFADFGQDQDRLVRQRPDNVLALLSLTKFLCIPGLRLGLAFGTPEIILRLKALLPPWSVNAMALRVGARGLKDKSYQEESRARTRELREELAEAVRSTPGFRALPSEANFLLCQSLRAGLTAREVADKLLAERIAIRVCDNFEGLDGSWFRLGVRSREDNARLAEALGRVAGVSKAPAREAPRRRVPALMVQGTCSNAGKSLLTAGLCRVFLQDGLRVAPFKAQNMSNNSFVTADGCEMGRAQVVQAQACRLAPDVRMNPVLLKPGSDTGSQVVVLGRAVGCMNVQQYVDYKPQAFEAVKKAYDGLAAEFDLMVLEGAGSPAEINLKSHDIVNMRMAEYAGARVLLVGDIDRGGVFAALAGTMELLTESERGRVLGYALNKFRGDRSLLDPALSALFELTGRPVLGVLPWLRDLGLPEEDSVSFGQGFACGDKHADCLDVACLALPRVSNFNDLDPLALEPDVRVRLVESPLDLGRPDVIVLPGSKSTVPDMRALRGAGVAAALRSLVADPAGPVIVGLCAGMQMLGSVIEDPLGLESTAGSVDGFGLLPLATTLAPEKTLARVEAVHLDSGLTVRGYEIHHGRSELLEGDAREMVRDAEGRALGFGSADGRVWGTYVHGVFDDDAFRRWFLDQVRRRRGLKPLKKVQVVYSLEPALDRLAEAVRQNLDMARIYRALGFEVRGRGSLL